MRAGPAPQRRGDPNPHEQIPCHTNQTDSRQLDNVAGQTRGSQKPRAPATPTADKGNGAQPTYQRNVRRGTKERQPPPRNLNAKPSNAAPRERSTDEDKQDDAETNTQRRQNEPTWPPRSKPKKPRSKTQRFGKDQTQPRTTRDAQRTGRKEPDRTLMRHPPAKNGTSNPARSLNQIAQIGTQTNAHRDKGDQSGGDTPGPPATQIHELTAPLKQMTQVDNATTHEKRAVPAAEAQAFNPGNNTATPRTKPPRPAPGNPTQRRHPRYKTPNTPHGGSRTPQTSHGQGSQAAPQARTRWDRPTLKRPQSPNKLKAASKKAPTAQITALAPPGTTSRTRE